MALEQLGINLVQTHPRHHCRIERHGPQAPHLAHQHVGHHIGHGRGAETPARSRVEAANAVAHGFHLGHRTGQPARQALDVACGQGVEVIDDDRCCQHTLLAAVDLLHLQQQALADIARCHAGRLERLHAGQGVGQLIVRCSRVECGDVDQLGQRRAQVAIVVERLDDGFGQHGFALRQAQQPQLAAKMHRQRGLDGHRIERRQFALACRPLAGCSISLPEVAVVFAVALVQAAAIGVASAGGIALALTLVFAIEFAIQRQQPVVVEGFGQARIAGPVLARARVAGHFVEGAVVDLVGFEKRILAQTVADRRCKVHRRHLQQSNGMLQARRKVLGLPVFGSEIHRCH